MKNSFGKHTQHQQLNSLGVDHNQTTRSNFVIVYSSTCHMPTQPAKAIASGGKYDSLDGEDHRAANTMLNLLTLSSANAGDLSESLKTGDKEDHKAPAPPPPHKESVKPEVARSRMMLLKRRQIQRFRLQEQRRIQKFRSQAVVAFASSFLLDGKQQPK